MRKRTVALVPLVAMAMIAYFALAASGAVISGTSGPDVITSPPGTTNIILGKGAGDTLTGNGNKDVILGMAGGDTIDGSGSNDVLGGGADPDTITGGGGHDMITGDLGNDTVWANDGQQDFIDCGGEAGDVANVDAIDSWMNCATVNVI